jgi:muramoyltetrapeptide carboxypeptidase
VRAALFDPAAPRRLRGPAACSLVPGRARGPLTGGNLSLLAASIGTAECRPASGAIALLEDVGEELYRIDRLVTQLLRAGWFDGVAGIALGSWQGCGDEHEVRALLTDRLGPLGVPTVWQLGFGHHRGSLALPLGAEAELDADTATLTVCGATTG